jgi:hypothetical protein
MARIRLRTTELLTEAALYEQFRRLIGIPGGRGASLASWIEAMTALRDEDGPLAVTLAADEVLEIEVPDAQDFRIRAPELFHSLLDAMVHVNRAYRRSGQPAAVALVLE